MKLINRVNRLWLLLLMITLSGCSSLQRQQQTTPDVYLSRQLQWRLPELSALPGQYQVTQSVHATYGDEQFDLLFQVEKQEARLAMAALTPNGQPLLQAVYSQGKVEGSVSPLIGNTISLAYLVSDFILAFGLESQLEQPLKQAGMTLSASGQQRVISHNNEPVITINYTTTDRKQWPDVVKFRNIALGYELVIRTLNRKPL